MADLGLAVGPGLDGRAEGAEGLAAVGGGVLGRLVDLGAGAVPAVGEEHRVVAEPAAATGAVQDPAVPGGLGVLLPARRGVVEGGHAAEAGRAALGRDAVKGGQELVQVGLVADTGPPRLTASI